MQYLKYARQKRKNKSLCLYLRKYIKRPLLLTTPCLFCFLLSLLSYTDSDAQKTMTQKIFLPGSNLKSFYKIAEGVYRSDQPSNKGFRALEKFGIKEVLNLRNWHSDNREARQTGLKLHRLRTKASTINYEEIIQALKIIHNRQGDIVVHCWHGSDRTGAVCAMYRIVFEHISKEEAIEEMLREEFGFHMVFDQIIDVIHEANIEQIRQEVLNP